MRSSLWNRVVRTAVGSSLVGALALALSSPASAQLGTASSAQRVFVVDDDGGPGVDFVELSTAVDTVGPGAILLIRSGTYVSASSIDQPISLLADEGAVVSTGSITVRNVSAGEVILHGLSVAPSFSGLGPTLVLENVSAPVLVQDCTLSGGVGVTHAGGGPGLRVSGCASVTLANCTVTGGQLESGAPSAAAFAGGSTVGLFGTTIVAADGTPGVFLSPPTDGGDGLVALSSLVFTQGTAITGGAGGDAGSSCNGADGGDGVVLGATSELRVVDSEFAGGPGGAPQAGCTAGANGVELDAGTSTVLQLPGSPRTLDVEAVLREQQTGTLTVTGQPGDLVILGLGYELVGQQFRPGFAAPLSIAFPPPSLRLNLGTVPAGGTLTQSFALAPLPRGLSFTTLEFQLQPFVFNGPDMALGNTRRLVVLNPRN